MKRSEMVRQGAEQLLVAENAIETALCEVATLGTVLGQMRMDGKLSPVLGQDVIDGIAVLYKRLSKVRRGVVELHNSLDGVKTQIGCGAMLVGSDNGKPPPKTGHLIEVVGGSQEAA